MSEWNGRERARSPAPAGVPLAEQLIYPRSIYVGVPILGVVFSVAILATALSVRPAGRPLGPAGVALLVAVGLPWALQLSPSGRAFAPPYGRGWRGRLGQIDVSLALMTGLSALTLAGVLDLGSTTAQQLALFPLLLISVVAAAECPWRRATVTIAVAYGALLMSLGATQHHLDAFDWTGWVTWHAGFALVICSTVAVRQGLRAMQRRSEVVAKEAAESRQHVARDVHDVVAHTLAITMLHMTAARSALRHGRVDEAIEALEIAERHGRSSLNGVRLTVRSLRGEQIVPPETAQPGLDDIDDLIASYRAGGLAVDVDAELVALRPKVSAAAAVAVYRALQEALANAVRHGTGSVSVGLRIDERAVELTVRNPCAQEGAAGSAGTGLIGMAERVAAAGGTIVAGRSGSCWEVRASVPVHPSPQTDGGLPS